MTRETGLALSCLVKPMFGNAVPISPDSMEVGEARNLCVEIALKQGVGRLIRDVDDRGVLVLCDPRLRQRSYGRVFLNSLPGMRRTGNVRDIHDFFAHGDHAVTSASSREEIH